jgi:secreted Zn-dependent insulinase-like peptidase
MTSTTYFFDVSADALEGALDRFSGFFFEPLFNEDCTEREIKAVDSEHKKNLQADMWVSTARRRVTSTPALGNGSLMPSLCWAISDSSMHSNQICDV